MKKILYLAILLVIAAPSLVLALDDSMMLTEKKYAEKQGNNQVDIFWDKSEMNKKCEEICYFEVDGDGLVEALRNANKMANKKGADAILIMQKAYKGKLGTGILFGKMFKYQ
jgi:hypothetical protein